MVFVMQERVVKDVLIRHLRSLVNVNDPKISLALQRASQEIAGRSEQDQRAAARTASHMGFMVSRGRVRL
jgi:hypothetical protein